MDEPGVHAYGFPSMAMWPIKIDQGKQSIKAKGIPVSRGAITPPVLDSRLMGYRTW
jgi:hypothetical protein